MPRETSPYIVGDFWLDKRRDGKSPHIWQIATGTRSVVYRSTHKREIEDAKKVIDAHFAELQSKQRQDPREARVVPLLVTYWKERGRKNVNHDQTGRSLRTFIGFLVQDEAGLNAVVTDMVPVVFERFREWRMGEHAFKMTWADKEYDYASEGVSGDTVARNLNDIRAGINHAQDNMRIAYAPKIKTVAEIHLNPFRDRVLTEDELARIAWYSFHFPALFRFVTLQMVTSVRPDAAKQFNPKTQFKGALIDLQPDDRGRTKKRNAVIPAIRPMRVVLRAWARDDYKPVKSNKTAWRHMRAILGLSSDVHAKTIRHTIATWLYADRAVPERQVSEMLGHEGKLSRTSRLYAKYQPEHLAEVATALTTIWVRISKQARAYGAVHLLTKRGNGPIILIDKHAAKPEDFRAFQHGGRGRD